jgi:hypothetical protein
MSGVLTWIYRFILLAIALLVGASMWREKRLTAQLAAALVLIPLLLRLLMVK